MLCSGEVKTLKGYELMSISCRRIPVRMNSAFTNEIPFFNADSQSDLSSSHEITTVVGEPALGIVAKNWNEMTHAL